jgi:hypothetical protein
VDISGQRVQADGGRELEVLVDHEGQESGRSGWGRQQKTKTGGGKPRGSGGQWSKQQYEGVGQRTRTETRCMTGVDQGRRFGRRRALAAPCYVWSHFYY